jgi:uncharacterized protein YbaP (TraB family)
MTRLNQALTRALAAIYLFLSIAGGMRPAFAAADTSSNGAKSSSNVVHRSSGSRPFLWKIESPAPSWLFGTIHSDDPKVATLPASVGTAFASSRSFHPEVEASAELVATVVVRMFQPNAPDLATRLPPALWIRVKKAGTAVGLPEELLQRLTPGFAALLFSAPANTNLAATVDGQLHDRAVAHGLAVVALETVDEQLALFEKLPDAQAVAALTEALDEIDAGRPAGRRLIAAYASGDESRVIAAVAAEFASSPAARSLAEPLLYRRNQVMADRLASHLRTGGAFVAIGVAHLVGPRSVIELLRARGWRITRVP